ncbi:uncharacterized protein LOC113859249 [Abrus precatorius]|uniref:Uncharacterized protein LOC113859249 n=1 Tax=Abrus precatorius TaxID=3816 RepID=A0A8B8KZR2_ABRPR|nr:uncharacterized protein LOC113859249 [Abrus precatorius]
MVVEEHSNVNGWPPIGAPLNVHKDEHWTNFDSSVNAVSFGFVATAILISMFLVMAIFERFLRPTSPPLSPSGRRSPPDAEAQIGFTGKLGHPSPKMSVYASGVSVLMPGDEIPTFIAHHAPCCPERMSWPSHQHDTLPCSTSNTIPNINEV